MRSTIFALACGAGLVMSGAALADQQQQQAQPQPVSATTQDPNNPVICHTYVHEGTLTRTGECLTQHQWDRLRRQNQEQINEDQLRSLQGGMP